MARAKKRGQCQPCYTHRSVLARPCVFERLESRRLLARNVIYIDFDPNTLGAPPPSPTSGDFAGLFSASYWSDQGRSVPSFLDIARTSSSGEHIFIGDTDGNGTWNGEPTVHIDSSDNLYLQIQIWQKVEELFNGLNVEVIVDPDSWTRLQEARQDPEINAFVIFVGDSHNDPTQYGVAAQAPIGANNEYFGWAYAGNIARAMQNKKFFGQASAYNRIAEAFVWQVAATIAHEVGHLLGLGHPGRLLNPAGGTVGYDSDSDFIELRQSGAQKNLDPFDSLMSSGGKRAYARFADRSYPVVDLVQNDTLLLSEAAAQNQKQELQASFSGSQVTSYNIYHQNGYSHSTSLAGVSESPATAGILQSSQSLDEEFSAETPVYSPPPSTLNDVGTPNSYSALAASFAAGFDRLEDQYLDDIASILNVGNGAFPFVDGAFADRVGLSAALKTLVQGVNVSSLSTASTTSELRAALVSAGFRDVFVVDNLLSAGPTDLLRASITLTLRDLIGIAAMEIAGRSDIGVLNNLILAGNADLFANVALHIGIGVDTGGFYLLPAKLVEGQISAVGSVNHSFSDAGRVGGVMDVSIMPTITLKTGNSDHRIRFRDLDADGDETIDAGVLGNTNAAAGLELRYFGGASLDATAEVELIQNQQLTFNASWSWNLDDQTITLDNTSLGVNDASLSNSLISLLYNGATTLGAAAGDLADVTNDIPFIQTSIGQQIKRVFSDNVRLDNLGLPSLRQLQARGVTFTPVTITADQLIDHAAGVSTLPSTLVELTYDPSQLTLGTSLSVAADGSRAFDANGETLSLSLSGELTATPSFTDIRLVFGLGTDAAGEYGIYIREDSRLSAAVNMEGALSGYAGILGFADIDAAASGLFRSQITFTIDDGVGATNRIFVTDPGVVDTIRVSPFEGTVELNDLTIALSILNLPDLPPVTLRGLASYSSITDSGRITISEAALLDAIATVAVAGINQLGKQAAALSRVIEGAPAIGPSLAQKIEPLITSALELTPPSSGVEQYLRDRGFEIVPGTIPSVASLIRGDFGEQLVLLRYIKTLDTNRITLQLPGDKLPFVPRNIAGESLSDAAPIKVEIGGIVQFQPEITFDFLLGLNAKHGPFLQEQSDRAALKISVDVFGHLEGKAEIGNLANMRGKIYASGEKDVTDPADFTTPVVQAFAGMKFSNGSGNPSERLYLFSESGSEFTIDDVFTAEQFTYGIDVDSAGISLGVATGRDAFEKIPKFGPILANALGGAFQWNGKVEYHRNEAGVVTSDYGLDQDAAYRQIRDVMITLQQGVIDQFFTDFEKFNPLPESFRNFLTSKIPMINESLDSMAAIAGQGRSLSQQAKVLFSGDGNQGKGEDEIDDNAEGDNNRTNLNVDAIETKNIIRLLLGQTADLISLDVKYVFDDFVTDFNGTRDAIIVSYFGVVDARYTALFRVGVEFAIDFKIGFDTKGFYARTARNVDDFVFSVTPFVEGLLTIGGALVQVKLVELAFDVVLGATGGIRLVSDVDADDPAKSRAKEILNGDNWEIGIRVFLKLHAAGSLGIRQAAPFEKVELRNDELCGHQIRDDSHLNVFTKLYCYNPEAPRQGITLYEATVGTVSDISESFAELREELKSKAGPFICVAESGIDPFTAATCIGLPGEEIRDAVNKANDFRKDQEMKARDFAHDVAEKAVTAINDAVNQLDDARMRFEDEFLKPLVEGTPLEDLVDQILADGSPLNKFIEQFKKALPKNWIDVDVTPDEDDVLKWTFDAELKNGVLTIDWDPNAAKDLLGDRAADLGIAIEDGELIVNGPAFDETITFKATGKITVLEEVCRIEDVFSITKDPITGEILEKIKIGTKQVCDTIKKIVPVPEPKEVKKRVTQTNTRAFTASDIQRIVIRGTSSDDRIIAVSTVTIPLQIEAGAGHDEIVGGNHDDYIIAGAGDDVVLGMGGGDVIVGGLGQDRLFGQGGQDVVWGGNEEYSAKELWDDVEADGITPSIVAGTSIDGSTSDGADELDGGAANDLIFGGGGDDLMLGGGGRDYVDGGLDNDDAYGAAGSDVMRGGQGADQIRGGEEADFIHGDDGADTLVGDNGSDHLFGGDDNDTLYGDGIEGLASGSDILHGEAGHDILLAGPGNDFAYGGSGADLVYGEAGADLLVGASENNEEQQDDANDLIIGDVGADTISGGRSGEGLAVHPTLASNQTLDVLKGGDDSDTIRGGTGPDLIDGGYGDDVLGGGDGDDSIIGFSGVDTISGEGDEDKLWASASDGKGSVVTGGAGLDRLFGSVHGDMLHGDANDDILIGFLGNDIINGGQGFDTLSEVGDVNFTLTDTSLVGNGDDQLSEIELAILDGGASEQVFKVLRWSGETNLNATGGSDAYIIELNGVTNAKHIIADSAGIDSLVVDGTELSDHFKITVGTILMNSETVQYADLEDITVRSRAGADLIAVLSTATASPLTLESGIGDDRLAISSQADLNDFGDLSRIRGPIAIDAGEGRNLLVVSDFSASGNEDVILTESTISNLAPEVITYISTGGSFDQLAAEGGVILIGSDSEPDVFHVHSTLQGSSYRLETRGGNDLVDIHRAERLDGIRGDIFVDAGSGDLNRLVLNDFRGGDNRLVDVTDREIRGLAPAAISYATSGAFNDFQSSGIHLIGSDSESDELNVRSTLAGSSYLVETHGENDNLNLGSSLEQDDGNLDSIVGKLRFVGGEGSEDSLYLNDRFRKGEVDYRITATRISHEPSMEFLTREFAGVDYDSSTEMARIDGSDDANEFNIFPSLHTGYVVDGNLPAPGAVCSEAGDYLKLFTEGTSGRRIQFDVPKSGDGRWTFTSNHKDVQFLSMERFNHVERLAVAAEAGRFSRPLVTVYDAETLEFLFEFEAYDSSYRGGVRVATGDIDQDGIPDIVTAPGRSHAPIIRVFDGLANGGMLGQFSAYNASVNGGVFIAVGDVDGDQCKDIVTIPGRGAAEVRVFESGSGARFFTRNASFLALPGSFIGGGTVQVSDMNNDGKGDIIVGSGSGMDATVKIFDAADLGRTLISHVVVREAEYRGGVSTIVGALPTPQVGSESQGVTTAVELSHVPLPQTSSPNGASNEKEYPTAHASSSPSLGAPATPSGADAVIRKHSRINKDSVNGLETTHARGEADALGNAQPSNVRNVIVSPGPRGSSQIDFHNWPLPASSPPVSRIAEATDAAFFDISQNTRAPVRLVGKDHDLDGLVDIIYAAQGSDGKSRRIRALDGAFNGFLNRMTITNRAYHNGFFLG